VPAGRVRGEHPGDLPGRQRGRFPGRFIFLRDARDRVVGAMAIFAPNEAWNGEGPRLFDL
jgi:hypothetical protein